MKYVYLAKSWEDGGGKGICILAIFEDRSDCKKYVDQINKEEEFKESPAWVDEFRVVPKSSEASHDKTTATEHSD